jgi:hypothetical protein
MSNYNHLYMNLNSGWLDIAVGECDSYTKLTHVKIEKRVIPEGIESQFDVYFQDPIQLKKLAEFLNKAAEELIEQRK